jgi:hypothetical protein
MMGSNHKTGAKGSKTAVKRAQSYVFAFISLNDDALYKVHARIIFFELQNIISSKCPEFRNTGPA